MTWLSALICNGRVGTPAQHETAVAQDINTLVLSSCCHRSSCYRSVRFHKGIQILWNSQTYSQQLFLPKYSTHVVEAVFVVLVVVVSSGQYGELTIPDSWQVLTHCELMDGLLQNIVTEEQENTVAVSRQGSAVVEVVVVVVVVVPVLQVDVFKKFCIVAWVFVQDTVSILRCSPSICSWSSGSCNRTVWRSDNTSFMAGLDTLVVDGWVDTEHCDGCTRE